MTAMAAMTVPQMVALAVEVLGGLGLFRAVLWHACAVDVDVPARHRGRSRSWCWAHRPRHRVYAPRKASVGPVEVGRTVDGDLVLVHAGGA